MNKLFYSNLPAELVVSVDPVELRLLREYGSVFVVRGGVQPPNKIIFADPADVGAFQAGLDTRAETIGGFTLELQTRAMESLMSAMDEAAASGCSITPRGADSARRSYSDTVGLWKSRVDPALEHWATQKRLTSDEAERISQMSPFEQVPVILRLEEEGIYFAKDLSKSILYSVAPPGTSQHLSMLALDVNEFGDQQVRKVLSRHRWYQTVISDLPHFTYLGVAETELPSLGLKKAVSGDRPFWVPDI